VLEIRPVTEGRRQT